MKSSISLLALACAFFSLDNNVLASNNHPMADPMELSLEAQYPFSPQASAQHIDDNNLESNNIAVQSQDAMSLFDQLTRQVALKITPGSEMEELCKAISKGNLQYLKFVIKMYCQDGPKDFFSDESAYNPIQAIAAMQFTDDNTEMLLHMLDWLWHYQDKKFFDPAKIANGRDTIFMKTTPLHTAVVKNNHRVLTYFLNYFSIRDIDPFALVAESVTDINMPEEVKKNLIDIETNISFYELGALIHGTSFINWVSERHFESGHPDYENCLELSLMCKDINYQTINSLINLCCRYLKPFNENTYSTILSLFVDHGTEEFFENILCQNPKILIPGMSHQEMKNTLFVQACEEFKPKLIKTLLEKGVDINFRGESEFSPLSGFLNGLIYEETHDQYYLEEGYRKILESFLFQQDAHGQYDLDWEATNLFGDNMHQVFENIIHDGKFYTSMRIKGEENQSKRDGQTIDPRVRTIIETAFNEFHNYAL